MKCQVCNCNDTIIREYEKEFIVKGKVIQETIKSRFCTMCNTQIYDEVLDEETAKKVLFAYSKKYGIEPKQIKQFRKKYNLSQDLFAKIIGCAKKTLISYENGTSIPNDTYMIIMKTLFENEETIQPIIEANKERFTEKEYNKIKDKVYPYIGNNIKSIYSHGIQELNPFNGFTKFSMEKLKTVVTFFADHGIHKTKLLKELFYTDFKCYKMFGYSITGLEYARIPYGPVPDNFEIILQELEKSEIIDYKKIIHENYEEDILKSKVGNDFNILTEEEIAILNSVKNYFLNFNVSKIVEFSHNEKAYKNTKPSELISYQYAFDLQI